LYLLIRKTVSVVVLQQNAPFSSFYYQTVVRRYFFSLSIIMTANLDTILPIGKVTAEAIL